MKRIKFQFFAGFCILSLVMIFLDSQGIFGGLRSIVQIVLTPVEQVTYSFKNSLSDSVSFLTFWKSGEERIKNLEQRNLELIILASKEASLEKENAELKKQLGVSQLSQAKRLPAEVLGVARFMTINRGIKDGIKAGQSVIYLDNFVGQIIRADLSISFVQLSTDADFKIPVKIGPLGTVRGVTLGQFNSSIILDQVAQDEEIKTNDLVLTSGEEGKNTPDMIVGRIRRIASAKTDLFQKAEVQPFILYDKLNTVFVVIQ